MTDLERLGLALVGFAVAVVVAGVYSGSSVPGSSAGSEQPGGAEEDALIKLPPKIELEV